MFGPIFLLAGGVMLLVKGADYLVSGAASLAKRFNIPPIVIGLTVVAFSTSAPELAVNLFSVIGGKPDIAVGNIIGSNIANILLILGATTLIRPLILKRQTVTQEIPMAFLASALLLVMTNDFFLSGKASHVLSRTDGIILLALFLFFLYYTYVIGSAGGVKNSIEEKPVGKSAILVLLGLIGLVIGGKLVVDGAVSIALDLGLSQRIIGLTVVAIGTSLPELVTSVTAASRKHDDIAVGNVIGSNIFNVFWILGLSATIRPLPFSAGNSLDTAISAGATALLFLAMFVGRPRVLERWQGAIFVSLYASYLAFIILA